MGVRKILKLLTLVASGLGVVSTTAVAGILAANSNSDSQIFAADTRHYKGEWYNEGALVYEEVFTRGQNVEYKGPTPTKVDYTGEKIYIFSGWDTTGDGHADLPTLKAYRNFKANATFTGIDASILEKIDWQKLLEILMDADIDLEALLAFLGLSPEDIAKLLGLNVFTVTSTVAGPAYFRTESFKDYNKSGHNWTDSDYYALSNISPGSVNPLQYTANKLSSLKNDPLFASYSLEGTYEITYNKSGGKYPVIAFETENNQGLPTDSYSLTNVGPENKYVSHGFSLIPCTEETVLAGLLTPFSNDAIKNDEKAYRDYVRQEYLGISDDYRGYFSNLADQIGASKNNVGQAVTAFTEYLTTNFTLDYKRNEFPKTSDPLMYFMNEARVADSNYFASAMTLFLRSLGYPARYTQGYMGAIAEPGVETPVTALQAYSWCEVYVDGIGWMNADGAEFLLVKLFDEYYDLPEEVLDMMDFSNKGTAKTLQSIRVGDNTKFNYVGGTSFSEEDIELFAIYDDGSEEKVKPCFVTKPDISDYKSYYDCNVTVLYEYLTDIKSATYTIHVEPAKVEELYVENNHRYTVVSPIRPEDFRFTGKYSNGNIYDIDSNLVSYTLPEITEEGDYPVEFTFTEYYGPDDFRTVTATFTLHIEREPVILSIEPMYYLERVFYTDEGFNFDRDAWYAFRSNGEVTEITIDDEMILNPEILEVTEPGTYTLEIKASSTCEVYEYTFELRENVLEYLEVYLNYSSLPKNPDEPYEIKDEDISCYAHYTKPGFEKKLTLGEYTLSQDVFVEEGTYLVEVTYSEEFEYAGLVTKTETLTINIKVNKIIQLYSDGSQSPTIHVNEEVDKELFKYFEFIGLREDGTYFFMNYDYEKLSYDFSKVDRLTPGSYEVVVSYTGSDVIGTPSVTIMLYVLGIKEFKGHFDNIPTELLTNTTYTTEDFYKWDIYATAIYYDGTDYEETSYIYLDDPNLQVILDTPFDAPGSYCLTLHYNDGYEDKTDSTIVTAYDLKPKEVTFDFSKLKDTYVYNASIDFSSVFAHVVYYGGSTNDITFDSGAISVESTSLGGVPEQVEYQFKVTIDKIDYNESFTITKIRPVNVFFDDKILNQEHCLLDPLNLSYYPVSIEYDNDYIDTTNSNEFITLGYVNEPKGGYNDVLITYNDGVIKIEKTFTLIMYDVYLTIDILEHDYFEGDEFTDGYNAYLVYDFGEYKEAYAEDVTENVNHELTELEGGSNKISFASTSYLYYGLYYYADADVFAYYLTDVEFDLSDFDTTFYRLDDIKSIDFSLIKVTGHYTNGNGNNITKPIDINDCLIEDLYLDELGTRTFTISYATKNSNFSKNFSYTVYEPKITNISFDTTNCKLVAYEGVVEGNINYSGLTYTLTYENGYTETLVYNEPSINGHVDYTAPSIDNGTKPGVYSMQFTYTHEFWNGSENETQVIGPENINATIKENNIERLVLDLTGVQRQFYVGMDDSVEFKYTNLVVYAITSAYNDFPELGKVKLSPSEYSVHSTFEMGTNVVTVSYNDDPSIYTTYEIEVLKDKPNSCVIYEEPGYAKQGEELNFDNIYIEVFYLSNYSEVVYQPDFEIRGDRSTDELGKHNFEIYYKDIRVGSFYIDVVEGGDVPLYISLSNTKIYIEQGRMDLYKEAISEISVYADFLGKKPIELDPSEYTMDDSKVDTNKKGTYDVIFTYVYNSKTYTATLSVEVTDARMITKVSISSTLTFYVGQNDFDDVFDSVTITLEFNDGTYEYASLRPGESEYVVFYNIPTTPSINDVTPGSTTLTGEIFVLVTPGSDKGFLVSYKYRVVEAS